MDMKKILQGIGDFILGLLCVAAMFFFLCGGAFLTLLFLGMLVLISMAAPWLWFVLLVVVLVARD
jgi:hypothetical protein